MADNLKWNPRGAATRTGLVTVLVVLSLAVGCSRLPERADSRAEAFPEVLARRQAFKGLEARGTLTLEHKADRLTVPVEITVTGDLTLEARGEVSHFLLPFEGEVRLVSDETTTLLHTDIGTYDLGVEAGTHQQLRAFLLSLAGGGDWLLWWLAGNDCGIGSETECMGLEIDLEPHGRLPSVSGWEVREVAGGAAFKARVSEYEPGSMAARVVTGIIQPQEIAVYMKYTEISDMPGPPR